MGSLRLGEEERLVQGYMEQSVFEPRPFLLYWGPSREREAQPCSPPLSSKKSLGTNEGVGKMPGLALVPLGNDVWCW